MSLSAKSPASAESSGSSVSNPAVSAASNPSVSAVSNPAVSAVSNPSISSVSNPAIAAVSSPALAAVSNPALAAVVSNPALAVIAEQNAIESRKASHWVHLMLVGLVLVALVALGYSVFLFLSKTEANRIKAEEIQRHADETMWVNAKAFRLDDVQNEETNDDNLMFFSLFSDPPGADVYQNGSYIGMTPIEQRKMLKESDSADILLVLDGYEIARRTVPMSENFSDVVELKKVVIQQPTMAAMPKDEGGESLGVVENKAVIINTAKNKKTTKTNKKGKDAAAPAVMDIALPD